MNAGRSANGRRMVPGAPRRGRARLLVSIAITLAGAPSSGAGQSSAPPPNPVVDGNGALMGLLAGGAGGYLFGVTSHLLLSLHQLPSDRTDVAKGGAAVAAVLGAVAGSVMLARRRAEAHRLASSDPPLPWIALRSGRRALAVGDSVQLRHAPDCGTISADVVAEVVAVRPDAVALGFETGVLTLRGNDRFLVALHRASAPLRRGDGVLAGSMTAVQVFGGAASGLSVALLPALLLSVPVGITGIADPLTFVRLVGITGAALGAFIGPTVGDRAARRMASSPSASALRFGVASADDMPACQWSDVPADAGSARPG